MKEKFIKDLHSNGLGGHFDVNKTRVLVEERYYWLGVFSIVKKWMEICRIYQHAKGRSQNIGL
jgi:hypothetical protein